MPKKREAAPILSLPKRSASLRKSPRCFKKTEYVEANETVADDKNVNTVSPGKRAAGQLLWPNSTTCIVPLESGSVLLRRSYSLLRQLKESAGKSVRWFRQTSPARCFPWKA